MYREDPSSIDRDWRTIFDIVAEIGGTSELRSPSAGAELERVRTQGHLLAKLNPLGTLGGCTGPTEARAAISSMSKPTLVAQHARTLAVETSHIDDGRVREWIHSQLESQPLRLPTPDRLRALDMLVRAEEFEQFVGTKFPGKKRFGIEGGESLLPMLDRLLRRAASIGVDHVYLGGMHRGRLNVMANVLGKPLADLFSAFKGSHPFPDHPERPADVAYHFGLETILSFGGRSVTVSLAPNPSHLEAVNAVVAGRARASQDRSRRAASILPVVLHTDASVVAQGVVAEGLQLGGLAGYSNGGSVHIVVNNQLGFTTEPYEARTSRYCTGPWKAIDSLILHVNGDDVDACLRAVDTALEFRESQGRDAVVDLVCFRRHGHNEFDEPRFTQPLLYAEIDSHATVRQIFSEQLAREGIDCIAEGFGIAEAFRSELAAAYAMLDKQEVKPYFSAAAEELLRPELALAGVGAERLDFLSSALLHVPEGLTLHPTLIRMIAKQTANRVEGVPWAGAEALAFATLLDQGVSVRLSGQDVARGAFSHRHLEWVDQRTGRRHVPLEGTARADARLTIVNSPLSEYATLGFEYGYSVEADRTLVIWEAQFGDFANGAQIVIDQFIVAGQDKWGQSSGLVLLLPHGLEGQGPEHSSARIERFLQQAAGSNVRIAHPTSPANYFHLLRDQALNHGKVPLIVFSPKTLLRLPVAVSPLIDFQAPRSFERIRTWRSPGRIERLVLCNGKLFYELIAHAESRGLSNVAVASFEQLYPFPDAALHDLLVVCPGASLTWVQEEPRNMGAYSYLDRLLEASAGAVSQILPVRCIARPSSGSPAGSFHSAHGVDQRGLVETAFAL